MNYLIEIIYLLLALVFLLILSINLTIQVFDVCRTEQTLRKYIFNKRTAHESLTYIISQLYIKKRQWIEAIQSLQRTLKRQRCYNSTNKYSLANLCNALGCVYSYTDQYIAAEHYFHLSLAFNPKHTSALRDLKRVRDKK